MSRPSITTDAIVLSTCHGVTTISHYRYCRVIYISWCYDNQSLLTLSCYPHIMVSRLSFTTGPSCYPHITMPRLSVTTDTIVLSTCHGATTISPYCYDRATYMPWLHDDQSLLGLPYYPHTMVPRQSVPTDTIVPSTHHGATTISHYWYFRAIHTSRCHDYQLPLIQSCCPRTPPAHHRKCRVQTFVWWGDRVRPTIS